MRCELFKQLGSGDTRIGEFLMFSQYTEDITKEQSMKSSYRVIPSKFVVLNLNINKVFNEMDPSYMEVSAPIIRGDNNEYYMEPGDMSVSGCDNIIPQIFQSYFENANSFIRNHAGNDDFPVSDWDLQDRSLASELLWRTLEEWGFIHKSNEVAGFDYYDEIKYIGDINIHSNHKVGSYSYDEVFCHIPANEDEYYYRLDQHIPIEGIPYPYEPNNTNNGGILNSPLEGWTDGTYPDNMSTVNRAITFHDPDEEIGYQYIIGGDIPVLDFKSDHDYTPTPRHPDPSNDEYNFNTIIIFYDVVYSEPGDEPRYIHKGRPMGIYLSGPVKFDNGVAVGLENEFTKFISNNDAYGQGASFELRIMMRYTATPNNSTYVMDVSKDGHDYETIAEAMGSIADAIVDINRTCKDQRAMYQAYKDHLAQFRNRMVNVPYIRDVAGIPYWFVNGRNTGQPVYPVGYEPRTDYLPNEIISSITFIPNGSASITSIEQVEPESEESTSMNNESNE